MKNNFYLLNNLCVVNTANIICILVETRSHKTPSFSSFYFFVDSFAKFSRNIIINFQNGLIPIVLCQEVCRYYDVNVFLVQLYQLLKVDAGEKAGPCFANITLFLSHM